MKFTILRNLAVALALTAVTAGTAQAGTIYTWKDAEGHVHYSDVPPPGNADVKKLGTSSQPAPQAEAGTAAKPTSGGTTAEKDLDFRRRRAEAQDAQNKAEKDQAAAAQRRQDCENVRNQLRALESGQRMNRFNDKGEPIPLDDEQRQAEIERNRQYLDKSCR